MFDAEQVRQFDDPADLFGRFGDNIQHLANVGDAYLHCQVSGR
jgi:hypothetical protein